MRCKRDLTTNKVIKHKARLNLHGGKQVYGMNYFKTYAPVVTWFAIRLMIVFGIIFCWALQQVDFVMAYLQALIEADIYMELPQGIKTVTGNSKDHVPKLLKNIYGQKQAGKVWNSFLVDKLTSLGYTSSLIDDCVFFCAIRCAGALRWRHRNLPKESFLKKVTSSYLNCTVCLVSLRLPFIVYSPMRKR
jgi:hypothetical protein